MAELFDCWFVEGELDWKNSYGNQYLKNDKFKKTRVKHNVSHDEAATWHQSMEVFNMARDAWKRGLEASYYWTMATDDEAWDMHG